MSKFLQRIFKNFLPVVHIFKRIDNVWPWKSVAGRKHSVPVTKVWMFPLPQCRGKRPPFLLTRLQWKTLRSRLLCHLKSLYQFVLLVEVYPYAKNWHHSSIQSWNASPNVELLYVWQSNSSPFWENHAKLYFNAKQRD